jgi:CheY-like chemotaxis protein
MTTARILIVEDERILAANLQRRITRLGYEVVGIVGSGMAAIEQARILRPDLVLMDLGLPGDVDRLAAAARLWQELQLPVVYVIAYLNVHTLQQVRTPAPVLTIRKPFDTEQVQTTLAHALLRSPPGWSGAAPVPGG